MRPARPDKGTHDDKTKQRTKAKGKDPAMQKQIYDDGYRRMVAHLKTTRKALGLTQADVAAKLGVCGTWVAKVEACELRLDLLRFTRLCRVYGLQPPDMLVMLTNGR